MRTYTLDDLTMIIRSGTLQDTMNSLSGGPSPAARRTATGYERIQYARISGVGVWPSLGENFIGVGGGDSNTPDRSPYYWGKWMIQVIAVTAGVGNAADTIDIFGYINNGSGANYTEVYRRKYYLTGAIPVGTTIIDLQMKQKMLLQGLFGDFNISSLGGNLEWNFTFEGIKIFWR